VKVLFEEEKGEEGKEELYMKWRNRFSKVSLSVEKSTMRVEKLKKGRGGNTFRGLRCCSDSYAKKTGCQIFYIGQNWWEIK
jgi:hypothetical protein